MPVVKLLWDKSVFLRHTIDIIFDVTRGIGVGELAGVPRLVLSRADDLVFHISPQIGSSTRGTS